MKAVDGLARAVDVIEEALGIALCDARAAWARMGGLFRATYDGQCPEA